MAKVVRGVDDYKKEFLSIFNSLCGRHGRWEVWSDFIQLTAIDISNVTDKGNAPKRAADARNIAKKYSEDEIKRMAEMLMQMVYAIDENPDQDFLGELYMACNLGNDHAGQFFTPYNVCQCMSEITYDVPALLDGKGFIAVNDPACGAGALLLSFANACKRHDINYQQKVLFVAQDMEPEGVPITPKGNATLVDDFYGDKQLITVTTKAGNYYYILIDRANEDKETSVHFLNQVDDADLLALLDEEPQETEVCTCTVKCDVGDVNENCPLCEKSLRNCTAPEAAKANTETPQEKPTSNMGSLMILLVLALAGGGAALYYFKFRKPKADTTGHDDLDEYDFGEDEDADEEPAEIEIHSENGQEDET